MLCLAALTFSLVASSTLTKIIHDACPALDDSSVAVVDIFDHTSPGTQLTHTIQWYPANWSRIKLTSAI